MSDPGLDPREVLAGRWRLLPGRAVLRFVGSDRVRYLNGQVSNDVAKLAVGGAAVAACVCTAKGKVEALVWIHAEKEALVVDGEAEQRDFLLARLGRYLVADDCEIEDATATVRVYHHFDESLPGIPSRRLGLPGRDLFLEAGQIAPFDPGREIDDQEWDLHEALALVPRSGWEITGGEFPAELGLDGWAVDFHKGCYLGQEIVSRIRRAGRVRHRLCRALAANPLAPGEPLRSGDGFQGLATRPSLPFGKKNHLALALGGTGGESPSDLGFQRVEAF